MVTGAVSFIRAAGHANKIFGFGGAFWFRRDDDHGVLHGIVEDRYRSSFCWEELFGRGAINILLTPRAAPGTHILEIFFRRNE